MASTAKDKGVSPSTFTAFDFVIVGGGLSGLVLAARLSADPNVSVGVLETGPWKSDDPKITTPGHILAMLGNPEYQIVTQTVPQKHIGGRQLACPRGRVLGGGSSVNFLVWHRGSKEDYDGFEALGNPGWNFETLARTGRKSETFHPPDTEEQLAVASTESSFHGKDGPVQTSFSGWIPEGHKAYLDVMGKLFGFSKNSDWHNGKTVGIRTSTSSIDPRTGTRSSSASAYYAPNAARSNLSILCGAHASKVKLEKKGDAQVATGVHYVVAGQSHFVKANKEVIVCAGALDSPQLLELSGVGNPSILQPLGIDVKVDNPNVGENLQDHVFTAMTYITKPGHNSLDALDEPASDFAKEAAAAYAAPSKSQSRGPLGATFCAMLFAPAKTFVPEPELGDLKRKLREETLPLAGNEGIQYQLNDLDNPERGTMEWTFVPRRLPSWPAPVLGRSYISLVAAIVHPFSRGNTHIISADVKKQPAIDPHCLESSWDKGLLLHGMHQLDRASREEPLASIIERRAEPAPGDDSIAVFEKYMHDTVIAGVHWVGTASMLPREKGGVVDPRCKVYGTSNLRVVDASILPLQVAAHPMATLYAVAERAAELIIEDHGH